MARTNPVSNKFFIVQKVFEPLKVYCSGRTNRLTTEREREKIQLNFRYTKSKYINVSSTTRISPRRTPNIALSSSVAGIRREKRGHATKGSLFSPPPPPPPPPPHLRLFYMHKSLGDLLDRWVSLEDDVILDTRYYFTPQPLP